MWMNRAFHWVLFVFALVILMGVWAMRPLKNAPSLSDTSKDITATVALPETLNVLFVGIDRRHGARRQHCDAIHLLHIDTAAETIEIVNVPRGTRVEFDPPKDWKPEKELLDLARAQLVTEDAEKKQVENPDAALDAPFGESPGEALTFSEGKTPNDPLADPVYARAWQIEQYVSNVCKYYDFETFVPYIERITGLKADYTVRIGFSETQAILRVLKFDPVTTLQFLRHRKTFPGGDVQRSYNQAIFVKDVLVTRSDLTLRVPKPARGALFHLLQTDMPYELAERLLKWLQESAINGDAARVTNRTAPPWGKLEEMHVSEETVESVLDVRLEHLARLQPGFEVQDVQPEIHRALMQSLGRAFRHLQDGDGKSARDTLAPLQESRLWLQVEDVQSRQRAMVVLAILDAWARMEDGEGISAGAFARDMHDILLIEPNAEVNIADIGALLRKIDALFGRESI